MLFSPSKFEEFLIKNDEKTILYYLMELNLIKRELICLKCCVATKLVKYTRNIDKFAWRCLTKNCGDYKKYFSVRYNSFFLSNLNFHWQIFLEWLLNTHVDNNSAA